MNPDEFLTFASQLTAAQESGAPAIRSAISRSYYCAYHLARRFVEHDMGVRIPRGGVSVHQRLQCYFRNCGVNEGIELAQALGDLQDQRTEADYDLHLPDMEKRTSAKLGIVRAQNIIERLATCNAGPLKSQIKAGIQKYKADFGR